MNPIPDGVLKEPLQIAIFNSASFSGIATNAQASKPASGHHRWTRIGVENVGRLLVLAFLGTLTLHAQEKSLDDVLRLSLTDLANFAKVNETMAKYFSEPFPARAAVGVKELPRGALVEADAVMCLGN